MQQPIHTIMQPGARWTPERVVGVGFVGVLHVIAITAILTGLTPAIIRIVQKPLDLVPQKQTEVMVPLKPIKLNDRDLPKLEEPVTVPEPVIKIAPEKNDTVAASNTGTTQQTQPPAPDTYAAGISGTHIIPDYPALARRLGEQGNVRLRLTISATGDVIGADIVQSSGFPDLDQTAAAWVMGHWKYKPASRGGIAVPGQTVAVVVFNLKNAR
jgi:periplasmic protein TonB